jgi:carbonic anhydrase/acetyltransferase-like protein (isoleucine patch superfamily)
MIRPFRGRRPAVAGSAYIDESAQLIGDVTVGERVSVWANATLRGDINSIRVGAGSNIQDNSCLHVDDDKPLTIGERVVVGHSCTVHACEVGDDCLIGMGSTILSGAKVGSRCLVAAGSLVLEGQQIPPDSVVMGSPAKVRRAISDEEIERIRENAASYVRLSREYLEES